MVNCIGSGAKHKNTVIQNKFCKFLHILIPTLLFSIFSIPSNAQFSKLEPGDGTSFEPIVEMQDLTDLNINLDNDNGVDSRMQGLGSNLAGDLIDPNTGILSFSHTDVSLPGNSNLEVAFRRTIYGNDAVSKRNPFLADWSLDIPSVAMVGSLFGNTVQHACSSEVPSINPLAKDSAHLIFGRFHLNIPGQASRVILANPENGNLYSPRTPIYTTKDHWQFECIGELTLPNGFKFQGLTAIAPNGNKYRFDVPQTVDVSQDSRINILYASEVTDVNGNWVRYEFDGTRKLARIHSNDNREITIQYVENDNFIKSVTANGRVWQYKYISTSPVHFYLNQVVQPDGQYWSFDLITWGRTRALLKKGDNFNPFSASVIHPNGARIDFQFAETRHGTKEVPIVNKPNGGENVGFCAKEWRYIQVCTETVSVTKKAITGAGMPDQVWDFEYEQDTGHYAGESFQSGLSPNRKTTITDPIGRTTDYFHNREWGWQEGQLVRIEKRANAQGAVLETINYSYIQTDDIGEVDGMININMDAYTKAVYPSKVVTQRDGDTFTTEYTYNTNFNSPEYSFGNPIQTSVYSNVSTTPRVTDMTYEHNTTKWILGLPKTITTNGRNIATYVYNSLGQKTSETRNGAAFGTYAYYTSGVQNGAIYWAKDALNRQTTAFSWERGTPQRIKRPDLNSTYQYVDNNGWLTSTKDANGNTTTYSRDSMGRLTTLTPPTGWTPTTISYAFGTNITQTISKGFASSVITYDSLFRPTLVKTVDSKPGVGSSSFVKSTYDAAGQAVFTSFPSASSNPTTGVTATYDGLGRVTSTAENVSPYATTLHHYFNANRHRVRDASGAETMYYRSGYSGPGAGPVTAIIQPTGITTYMYRNVWDELTSARQVGTQNGVAKDESHYYYYNTRRQLCRHFTQSGRGAVFAYDNAGQMTSYNRGVGSGTTCDTPAGNALVDLTYDALGRVTDTNYTNANTPDISRVYDNNGNLTQVNRGSGSSAVDWAYTYDNMNNLTAELLTVDGGAKSFPMYYGYDADGYMTSRELPSGRVLAMLNDGLGRVNKIKQSVSAAGKGTGQEGPDPYQVYAQNISYHASGAITGMDYGNGQLFTQTLNARLQPLRMLSQKGGTKALDLTYGYDVRGKVTSIVNGAITGDNRTYNYDDLGRLTSATGPWGNSNYKYDALGNILEKKVGNRTIGMNYNAINRLTSHVDKDASGNPIAGTTVNLSYDSHGNVTWLDSQRFRYDMAEQPYEILGDVVGDYVYDGNLKRVKAVVAGKTIYNVYDASGTLVHVDETTDGKYTDYIGKIARVNNGGWATWLHMDHLGSTQTGTDMWGQVAWREKYTPYGTTLINPASNNDQAGFTGHIKDSATGLTYMQARYYDPLIGRFLSIDPVGFSVGQPQMFNRYSYVSNDPVNGTDPTGMTCDGCMDSASLSRDGFTPEQIVAFRAQQTQSSRDSWRSISNTEADNGFEFVFGAVIEMGGACFIDGACAGASGLTSGVRTTSGAVSASSRSTYWTIKGVSQSFRVGARTRSAIGGTVDGFMSANSVRLGEKLGSKLGHGRLPFEISKSGFNDAVSAVSSTLANPSKISREFTTTGGNIVRDIYSKTTGMTVRVRRGGEFDTLIPNITQRF